MWIPTFAIDVKEGEWDSEKCYNHLRGSCLFEVLKVGSVIHVGTDLLLSHFSLSVDINVKGGDFWKETLHMLFGVVIDGNPCQ